MIKVSSYTKTGQKQDSALQLDQDIFGVKPNHDVLALADRAYLASRRQAGAKTLTRGDVSGGGKKPWRQKGTGRARAGSSRLPHWRSGGVAFGPTGLQNFKLTVPAKVKRQAVCQALSAQAGSNRILVVELFSTEGKTKAVATLLKKLKLDGNILLVLPRSDELIERATRNIAGLHVVTARYLNVHNVLSADWVIITRPALDEIKDWLGQPADSAAASPASKATTKSPATKLTNTKTPAKDEQ